MKRRIKQMFTIACMLTLTTLPLYAQEAGPEAKPEELKIELSTEDTVIQEVSTLENEMIGHIDWVKRFVYAVGDGVPPEGVTNAAQARVRAKRAAIDEAYARLLEMTNEVRVDAESTTRNFVNENRAVNTRVSGIIKNAEIVEIQQASDGSYQVKMKMPMDGEKGISAVLLPVHILSVKKAITVMHKAVPDTKEPKAASNEEKSSQADTNTAVKTKPTEIFTGLIVDATGLGLQPALYPTIKTVAGDEIYNLSVADPNAAITEGLVTYRNTIEKAKEIKELIGDDPLVIKAEGVDGDASVDVVISEIDAKKICEALQHGNFLKEARVVVVIE